MARFIVSSPTNFRQLFFLHHPRTTLLISASARRNWMVARSVEPPPSISSSRSSGKVITRATYRSLFELASTGVPIPNIPVWARLVLASVFCMALPFYKKILRIEGEVEKDVETVAEAVEAVAKVTEKIAADVADAIPGDGRMKQLALEVEHIAEEVAKDADQVEAFLHKLDQIEEEIDTLVEPLPEKTKITVEENLEKKDTKPITVEENLEKKDTKPSKDTSATP